MSTFKIRAISEIALLAAFIAVSGAFKLPSFIPGSEFQLSAPLAVAICGVFGIKKYLLAGLLASAGGLLLGTQTIFNVLIAFQDSRCLIICSFRQKQSLLPVIRTAGLCRSTPCAQSCYRQSSLSPAGGGPARNDFYSFNGRIICFCP